MNSQLNKFDFNINDTVGIYGNKREAIQAMIDYDYICHKPSTSIKCIIDPVESGKMNGIYFWGNKEIIIPVATGLDNAVKDYKFSIFVNFASSKSAFRITKNVLNFSEVEKIIVIAEDVPERESRVLKAIVDKTRKIIIGPATVGGLISNVIKIGNAGGTTENVIESELYISGHVGIVSKSGGMLNELMTIVAKNTDGVCQAITTGGDRYPITPLSEQILRFENNKDIKLIVMFGEIGGVQEYKVVEYINAGVITKPIIAWVSGKGAKILNESIQFGHAGAFANNEKETTIEKVKALKEAGVMIPENFSDLGSTIQRVADKIGIGKSHTVKRDSPTLFKDFEKLMSNNDVRYKKNFITSISKNIKGEETYFGQDIVDTAKSKSIGYIIGLLWLKKEFPDDICSLIELIIKLTADHGPLVSGAHNTIVASRAGKDLISSLVSGLLTIGPRFGGAINNSALYLKWAIDSGLSPFEFVEQMKNKGINIPGIGHKVKRTTNPDLRVKLLKETVLSIDIKHSYLEYALKVEEITTKKKDSLILNIDGVIAVILLDILTNYFSSEEINNLLKYETFNGFFVLARTIGLIGHFIDQKRLDQGLYRVPEWDLLEV